MDMDSPKDGISSSQFFPLNFELSLSSKVKFSNGQYAPSSLVNAYWIAPMSKPSKLFIFAKKKKEEISYVTDDKTIRRYGIVFRIVFWVLVICPYQWDRPKDSESQLVKLLTGPKDSEILSFFIS